MREGWKIEQLKNICKVFVDGDWIETKNQSSKGIRLVQTGNIGFGYFNNKEDKSRFISEETFKDLKCTEILPGDLLVSRLPDPVGKSCIIPDLKTKMITGVDCTIIRLKEYLSPQYLLYYQMSNQYLKDVDSRVTGTTRSRISRKNLGLISIPIPPLPEQKQIVAILDKAFAAIDQAKANIEKNIQNAKELFQSKLNQIISQKDEGWEEKRFKDVCVLQRGFDLPKRLREHGEYLLVSSSGIIDTHVEAKVKAPGVVTGRSGSIGNLFYIEDDFWPLNTTLYIKDFKGNIEEYVYYFIKQFDLKRFSSGTGVPTLNRNFVHDEIVFSTSDIETQKQIVNQLNSLKSEIEGLESYYKQKLTNLEELKKSILQKAFTGELTKEQLRV